MSPIISVDQNIEEEEIRARAYLDELNSELNERRCRIVTAEWDYNSNITKENEERKDAIAADNAEFTKVGDFICYHYHLEFIHLFRIWTLANVNIDSYFI